MLLNFKGFIIDTNLTTEKLLGYNKEFLINKSINDLDRIYPPQIKPFFKQIFKASFKGEFPEPIEINVKRKDGTTMWVKIQSSLAKIAGNLIIQFVFQDITENLRQNIPTRSITLMYGEWAYFWFVRLALSASLQDMG